MNIPKLWKPLDVIVIVLTVTICGALGSAVLKPLFTGVEMSPDRAELVATMMASVISIVSMYVGAKLQSLNRDPPPDRPQ